MNSTAGMIIPFYLLQHVLMYLIVFGSFLLLGGIPSDASLPIPLI